MDLDLEVMGRRVARARVAADEATPPVDLRSERAGLAAADDMLSLEERRGSRDMDNERECDSQSSVGD